MKLNLGCGTSHIPGYINVDINMELDPQPNESWDLRGRFPYGDNKIDEIILFHTIEHIEKYLHDQIFKECFRVLKPESNLYLAYPEFITCAQYYIENKRGGRDFWEKTIYGRQLSKSDYHVALMNTKDLIKLLETIGFYNIIAKPEDFPNEMNTLVKAVKGVPQETIEDIYRREIFHATVR